MRAVRALVGISIVLSVFTYAASEPTTECDASSGQEYDEETETSYWWYRDSCTTRDVHEAGVGGLVWVETGNREWSGVEAGGYDRAWSEERPRHYGEQESVQGRTDENYTSVTLADRFQVREAEGCYNTYASGDSTDLESTENETHTWATREHGSARQGCGSSVETRDGDRVLARYEDFEGCQGEWEGTGTFEQHYGPDGIRYEDSGGASGPTPCGRQKQINVAGEKIAVERGASCDYEASSTSAWDADSFAYDSYYEEECVDGIGARGPADARLAIGKQRFAGTECHQTEPTGTCTSWEEKGTEGIWIAVAGQSLFYESDTSFLSLLP